MKNRFNINKVKDQLKQQVVDKGTEHLKEILRTVGTPEEQTSARFKFIDASGTVEIAGISENTKAKILEALRSKG